MWYVVFIVFVGEYFFSSAFRFPVMVMSFSKNKETEIIMKCGDYGNFSTATGTKIWHTLESKDRIFGHEILF